MYAGELTRIQRPGVDGRLIRRVNAEFGSPTVAEFSGLGDLIKKVKKAVSIKNVVKVVKKAAVPVALAVATGGTSALTAVALKKAAGTAIKKATSKAALTKAAGSALKAALSPTTPAAASTRGGLASNVLNRSIARAQDSIRQKIETGALVVTPTPSGELTVRPTAETSDGAQEARAVTPAGSTAGIAGNPLVLVGLGIGALLLVKAMSSSSRK